MYKLSESLVEFALKSIKHIRVQEPLVVGDRKCNSWKIETQGFELFLRRRILLDKHVHEIHLLKMSTRVHPWSQFCGTTWHGKIGGARNLSFHPWQVPHWGFLPRDGTSSNRGSPARWGSSGKEWQLQGLQSGPSQGAIHTRQSKNMRKLDASN